MSEVHKIPGQVRNAPPTLEWVAVDLLAVDPAYQRATNGPHSRRIIFGMVKCWDWALCQPLVISRREDGSLFILDGQHRHAGAVERGDIRHLPCVILAGCNSKDEAITFVALNTKRQKLTQGDIFNGMLAASDPVAKATAALLERTGWRARRNTNTQSYLPGDLGCAPMLTKALALHGEAIVTNALTALREAYADTPVRNAATLLKALIVVFRDNACTDDPDLFIETIGQVEPGDWEMFGQDYRRRNPALSRIDGIAGSMVDAYHDTLRSGDDR